MSSFLGFDYELHTSCLLDSPSLEVDAIVAEMGKVADMCLLDAHATTQCSITSMHTRYALDVPAEESPFAFSLPDDVAKERMQGQEVFMADPNNMPESTDKLWGIAKQIVELKRAGRDREALELLMGAGGRAVEGFGIDPDPWRPGTPK